MRYGKFWIAIISKDRWANVPAMQSLIDLQPTWYIGGSVDEHLMYQAHGAKFLVRAGGLCDARNAALEDAFALNLICVQLDDDLVRLNRAVDKRTIRPLSFKDALDDVLGAMDQYHAYLGGVAPTDNAFYFNPDKPISTAHFCVGSFSMYRPCHLRFDRKLRLKEDYDMTLQHLSAFGVVARRNDVLATFRHYTNAGGAVDVRTTPLEQATIQQLKDKWGDAIRDNPRRANEILLHWQAAVRGE